MRTLSDDPQEKANSVAAVRTVFGSFVVMAVVGSMYGMSALLVLIPGAAPSRLPLSVLGFGAASAGLAAGTVIAGKLLIKLSPRTVGVVGAITWSTTAMISGGLVAAGQWRFALAPLALGGIGIGLTYLTVVVNLGPRFPNRPVLGASIGPAGFSAGTVVISLTSLVTLGSSSTPAQVGSIIVVLGVVGFVLSLTGRWLPGTRPTEASTGVGRAAQAPRLSATQTLRLAVLLGVNALPGMLLLSFAFPILESWTSLSYQQIATVLAASMVMLFAGGLISPTLTRRVGTRGAFVALLAFRGVLLVVTAFSHNPVILFVLLACVLIGHGSGFAILPGVTRKLSGPRTFASDYGLVLGSWGLSGVLATLLGLASWYRNDSVTGALLVTGALVLLTAVGLSRQGVRHPLLS
ncbi:hypothetical protein [Rhodococcoides fascians]|uniref:hypothetical protein n=1 Tax=Rhodococcoides fascians TaxID=1828 RepID=UPI00050C3018|nr:hypothetical protein [Rhodococcus fascians]